MPFTTEISNIKTEINAGLAASQYTAKDLVYVSKAIEALANAETVSGVFDTAIVDSLLYVGTGAAAFAAGLTNPIAVFQIDQPDYSQIAFRNTNSTANASTDIILYTNDGTDESGWIDMGITSTNFADPDFTITGKGDGYIFVSGSGNDGNDRGNLVLATNDTGTQNKIIFAAGGLASDNTQMEITPDVNVHIEIPTPSTSSTTGALTVVGGVGVQGDMNVQGNVAIEGTITFGGAGTTVETQNLAVTDPAVFVGTNNQADIVDLAFIGEYATSVSPIVATVNNKALTNNVATLTTASAHTYLAGDVVTVTGVDATFNGTFNIISVPTSTTFTYAKTATNVTSTAVSPTGTATVNARRKFAGIARDASDGVIKVFKDATTKPITTINFSEAGLGYADFRIAGLTASSANITSATIGSVTNTEIGYLSGVTSAIQTQLNAKAVYPSQSGQSGLFLTTDGTNPSWATVYPSQTGNSGRYLTTNGTTTSWAVVDALPSQTNNSGKYLTTNGTSASWATITTDPLPDVFMMMGA